MPTLEQLIKESETNIELFREKVDAYERLHTDFGKIMDAPQELQKAYTKVSELAQTFVNDLGSVTTQYLTDNNNLFVENLKLFSDRLTALKEEVDRLLAVDFNALFVLLQKAMMEQTRKDMAVELKKFDDHAKILQSKIEAFQLQIDRLASIDLEGHFETLRQALNKVNESVSSVDQNVGRARSASDNNHQKVINKIQSISDGLASSIKNLDGRLEKLKSQNATNFTVLIIAASIVIALLTVMLVRR